MNEELRKRLADVKRLMENAATVGEAEAAAAAMQRLILRHNLSEADLHGIGDDPAEPYESLFIRVSADGVPGIQWKLNLVYALAEYNFCAFVRQGVHGATGWVVGQPSNRDAVQMLFLSTVPTVDRLSLSEWALLKRDKLRMWEAGNPSPTGWKNAFKLGFVVGLIIRMRLERKQQINEDHRADALVVVKNEELEIAKAHFFPKMREHKPSQPQNLDGFLKGIEKGRVHETTVRVAGGYKELGG